MGLEAVQLASTDELYALVESAVAKTALILEADAPHRPWARAVASQCPEVRWLYPERALSDQLLQHLANLAHAPMPEKGFVLMERGRVIKPIDVVAVGGASEPHRLPGIVRNAFRPKVRAAAAGARASAVRGLSGDPYELLGVSPEASDSAIRKRYKKLLLDYHPDRVNHLGEEIRDLAARKTTEINQAYAAIKELRRASLSDSPEPEKR
jgi:hypothetical protein